MRLCELRQKEVINCNDCQKLGYVCDIEFDPKTGCIKELIIPGPCKIWGILGRDHEYIIPMCQVKKIGADIVLVDVEADKVLVKCKSVC